MSDGDAFYDISKFAARVFHLKSLSDHADKETELQRLVFSAVISGSGGRQRRLAKAKEHS